MTEKQCKTGKALIASIPATQTAQILMQTTADPSCEKNKPGAGIFPAPGLLELVAGLEPATC